MANNTSVWYRRVGAGLATLVLFCIVGYVAYEAGVKKGVQQAFYCNAIHAQSYVSALRALRGGDTEGGLRMLEVSLDAGVVLMAPDSGTLENRTEKAVLDTLSMVRECRTAFPGVGDPETNAKVDRLLSGSKGTK